MRIRALLQPSVLAKYGGGKIPTTFMLDMPQSSTTNELRKQVADRLNEKATARLRMIAQGHVLKDTTAQGDASLLYNDYGFPADLVTIYVDYVTEPKVAKGSVEGGVSAEQQALDEQVFANERDLNATQSAAVTTSETSANGDAIGKPRVVNGYELGRIPDDEPEPGADEYTDRCTNGCKKDNRQECKYCGCDVCGSKRHDKLIVLCDGYDTETGQACPANVHTFCMTPPLTDVPEDDWYCDACLLKREGESGHIVTEHDLKERGKKAAKLKSASASKKWGGGYSTAGQERMAQVDTSRRGPVAGIRCGQLFFNRATAAMWGVHTQPMCGIMSGMENGGAMAICISGGYDDDADLGDVVTYTGEGGKDLSNNKRTTVGQQSDQAFVRGNLALSMCMYPVGKDGKTNKGGDAKDNWRKGLGIRVIRGYDKKAKQKKNKSPGHKPNPVEPEEGYRYDGIYKITRYWSKQRDDNNMVFQFELRRDDQAPPPWTEEGKKIQRETQRMLFPDDTAMTTYFETKMKEKENENPAIVKENGKSTKRKSGRASSDSDEPSAKKSKTDGSSSPPPAFSLSDLPVLPLPDGLQALIDRAPERYTNKWADVMKTWKSLGGGLPMLIKAINDIFICVTCYTSVALDTHKPMRLPCDHCVCTECWHKLNKTQVCRYRLGHRNGMTEKDLDELKSIACPACRVHLCALTSGHEVQVDDELYAHLNKVIFY